MAYSASKRTIHSSVPFSDVLLVVNTLVSTAYVASFICILFFILVFGTTCSSAITLVTFILTAPTITAHLGFYLYAFCASSVYGSCFVLECHSCA